MIILRLELLREEEGEIAYVDESVDPQSATIPWAKYLLIYLFDDNFNLISNS